MIGAAEARAAAAHGPLMIALVSDVHGSAPVERGRAMLIWPDRIEGTIGGGSVEFAVIEKARAMLADGSTRDALSYALNPSRDQCCGGRMDVALARLDLAVSDPRTQDRQGLALALWPGGPVLATLPDPRPVYIYGAGHVGTALIQALAPLPFSLTWVDTRTHATLDGPVPVVVTPLPEAEVAHAPDTAAHVVLTHSHALDLEIVTAVLGRPHAFCGLIGSATKRAFFRRRLGERGLSKTAIDGLVCPIGIPGLSDRRPAVIAASVAAQLLRIDCESAS